MDIKHSTTCNLVLVPPVYARRQDAVIDRLLFYPAHADRKYEGGLRTQGKYKQSLPGKPLVSILTAVFNGARFLEQTIQSVLNQDYDNIEFIVIDGGSTDGTQNVIRRYEHALDYWVSEPDHGISDAFNKAVLLSSGDYLNFQGAGDYLVARDVLSRAMSGVDAHRDMLISAGVQRVREDNCNEIVWISPRRFSPSFNKHSLLFRMSLPHQGLMTNRRMFERYGLFDTSNRFSMDYEHLLRAYHEFPNVVMKDVIFSAWRDGGIGLGRTQEILLEYARIKTKNKVAPPVVLWMIEIWSSFKFNFKKLLGHSY
jgi:glycosyltransferase involved in cell wall biosynthesis